MVVHQMRLKYLLSKAKELFKAKNVSFFGFCLVQY